MKRMKKTVSVLLILLLIISAFAVPGAFSASARTTAITGDYVEGEVIAVLKNAAETSFLKSGKTASLYGKGFRMKNAFTIDANTKDTKKVRAVVLRSDELSTQEMIARLKSVSAVKYALPNRRFHISGVTADTYSDYQWALGNTGQNGGTPGIDTKADLLWEKAAESGEEQVVAIIDTGIDLESPEFADRIWTNPYGKKLLGKHGRDFSGTISNGTPTDDNGHGSHCAGIIAAAADNAEGISGINRSNIKIMPLKFLDENGGGFLDDALACFDYISRAIDLGTNITAVSCSWGGLGTMEEQQMFDEIFDELGAEGTVTFVAAGNDGRNLSESYSGSMLSMYDEMYDDMMDVPACSDSPYCVTVAASDENGALASFSNYSPKYVDVAAPGTNILSTVSYNCFNPTVYNAEKRAEVVKTLRDFNDSSAEGELWPSLMETTDSSLTKNVTFTVVPEKFFGLGGSSLAVTTARKRSGATMNYVLAFPFTLDSENGDYDLSFLFNADAETLMTAADVPADFDFSDVASILMDEDNENLFGTDGGSDWVHATIHSDPTSASYEKAVDRKLVLLVMTKGSLWLDDVAVSRQNVSDRFGKYDFYSGTSMATPYAAGAYALLCNVLPEASPFEIVNIVMNTGAAYEGLNGLVKSGKTLTLNNISATPPLLSDAFFNADGNIELQGLLKNITHVTVGGEEVAFAYAKNGNLVIADDGYTARILTFTAENADGIDSLTAILSDKLDYLDAADYLMDMPYSVDSENIMIPAGAKALIVSRTGNVSVITYDEDETVYDLDEGRWSINFFDLFPREQTPESFDKIDDDEEFDDLSDNDFEILSAAYVNRKLFFTIVHTLYGKRMAVPIGCEGALGCLDLDRGTTVKLCDLPDEGYEGASLASFKGSVYLIGGYDREDNTYFDTVYRYNAKTNAFDLMPQRLPEGRAYANFVENNGMLVGGYGAVASGVMPAMLSFDGKSWKESSVMFDTEDAEVEQISRTVKQYRYRGSLGCGDSSVFCQGCFIYGVGDSFTYDPVSDVIVPSRYSFNKVPFGTPLCGATVPNGYIGFYQGGDGPVGVFLPLKNRQGVLATPMISKLESVYGGVKITWGRVDDASRYRVFRRVGSGKWARLSDDIKGLSFIDKTVKSGTTYTYTVRCVSAYGMRYTSSYDARGKDIAYVAAPTVAKLANANGATVISWNKVAGAAKYRIFVKNADGSWSKLGDTASTSFSNKRVKAGATYTYTVRALNAKGAYVSGYDPNGRKYTYIAPPSVTDVKNTKSGVSLSWRRSAGAVKYRVFRKTDNGKWTKLGDVTSLRFTDKTAKNGVTYTYAVRCINAKGTQYHSAYIPTKPIRCIRR